MSMKVLVADMFEKEGLDELRRAGCEVVYEPKAEGDALRDAIARTGCVVLVVRGTKVTEPMLSAGSTLSVVVRAGAGYNTIDVDAASRQSILVANCPGKNAVAVAELTFGLILDLDRRISDNVADLRGGKWNKKVYSEARGLKDRTLGVIGVGQIGQAVIKRARAFEMHVVAWSRSLTPEKAEDFGVEACSGPGEVAARCDVLTLHLPATPETKGLVNAEVIDRLKPGSYLINTARAEVVDYKALAAAVASKGLRVGLDVYPDEPSGGEADFKAAILQAGGIVYGTHHIGASTEQAQQAIAAETVRIVKEYMRTGHVANCVNLLGRSRARYVVVVRHRNRPGVLAFTLNEISHAGVNVEEMENVICAGAESACAQIKLAGPLPADALQRIRTGNEHVLGVTFAKVPE
jgi:D-3-phosphoglycerate dehydrogenase